MFLLAAAVLASASVASLRAQKLAIGERAPEINAGEWLTDKPSGEKAVLINFYHSSSREAGAVLSDMNSYAEDHAGKLEVVVIAREPKDKVKDTLLTGSPKYLVAIDGDGRTFAAFGVKVVPFGALLDAKGKVLWFGNPAQLDKATLEKLLK